MRHRAGDDPQDENLDDLAETRSTRVRVGVGAGVVILIVALVGAVVTSAFAQQGSGAEVPANATSGSSVPTPSGTAQAQTQRGSSPVLVHVLGAVRNPGLVSLSSGARVVDAVAAADGLTDDAELAGINLARVLGDGEQLVVPRIGEVVESATGGGAGTAGAGTSADPGAAGGVVNLNSATQQQLETLPRIGPALAQRILDWRTSNGRFASPADLLKVTGIGQKLFDGLKDRITA